MLEGCVLDVWAVIDADDLSGESSTEVVEVSGAFGGGGDVPVLLDIGFGCLDKALEDVLYPGNDFFVYLISHSGDDNCFFH